MPIITEDINNQGAVAGLLSKNIPAVAPVSFILKDISSSDEDRSGLITKLELET